MRPKPSSRGKQLTYVGRLSLLELGHAAVVARADNAFAARLRDTNEYLGADAELRAMLLLRLSGAELERAPTGVGLRRSEFIAKWSAGSQAVVEVKATRTSDEVELAERLIVQVIFAIAARADELPGFTGRVKWNEETLFGSPPDTERNADLARLNIIQMGKYAIVTVEQSSDNVGVEDVLHGRSATGRLERRRTSEKRASSSSPVSPSQRPISRNTSATDFFDASIPATARTSTVSCSATLTRTGCVGSRFRGLDRLVEG